jgi:hypothetical protein
MKPSTDNDFDDETLVVDDLKGWNHATLTFPGSIGMTTEAAAVLSASLELAVADGDIVSYHFLRKNGVSIQI